MKNFSFFRTLPDRREKIENIRKQLFEVTPIPPPPPQRKLENNLPNDLPKLKISGKKVIQKRKGLACDYFFWESSKFVRHVLSYPLQSRTCYPMWEKAANYKR